MVFKDDQAKLYSDALHLNGVGYNKIAELIGNLVRADTQDSP
jgi:hypothetical protein